ncbi:MAG: tRNA preQ1(34) S-adenosylmethionine ribosyltransferase-isomerase QueA [Caulobacteraceae bacterium]|nr:tRNA preQ1(34) S-adenosylmethionine ribosyltransferase-isomerase QueA [Caulobacteraceae bacterium]
MTPEDPSGAARLSDFDFDLPEDRIALRPAVPRDGARMLEVASDGALDDRWIGDLPSRLRPGDALVFNDTRVIAARLSGTRMRQGPGVAVEATLHKRLSPWRWTAFMRPGKRLRVGDRIAFGHAGDRACLGGALDATVEAKQADGEVTLAFDLCGADLDLAIAERGEMPLPPYIATRRAPDERDRLDYQTLFARVEGSVAAPTAGLHFTAGLMDRLANRGVSTHFVTLHVGAGTFLPVKSEVVADHRMHGEYGDVSEEVAQALNTIRADGGRIVCVGTTSLRLLESAVGEDGRIVPFAGETAIFITPGYRFRAADALITNFHLPRSTLFMLACAFSGAATMKRAYGHAIAAGYRFYSYGDASLLWRAA